MELRLQQFIDSVEQLSDIRNLDNFNPIVFQMEKPLTSTRFTVAGSKVEPSYLGVPVNTTWVVLDPTSPYYRKALKLRDKDLPDQVTDLQPIIIGEASLKWHIVRTYNEIFEDAQYYIGTTGPMGPVGPTGPAGEGGTGGGVDPVATMIKFREYAGVLAIKGPASVSQGQTRAYELELQSFDIALDGTVTPITKPVLAPIMFVGTVPANVAMQPGNNLTVGALAANSQVKLHASVLSWANMVEATLDVVLTKAQPVSLAINGAAEIYAGDSSTYTAEVTYDDGSKSTVAVSWLSDDTQTATVTSSGGVLSGLNPIAADKTIVLSASIVIGGSTLNATKDVLVKKLLAVSMVVNGSASLNSGATSTYTAVVTFNSGRTKTVTPTWTSSNTAVATISAGGVLSGVSGGSTNVQASYTNAGETTAVNATKAVTVVAVSQPIYAYYGPGDALPADLQTFVTGLAKRGTVTNLAEDITMDVGNAKYGWYCYPASYGYAQFMDKDSPLGYGGFGGAGLSGPGSSPATLSAGNDMPIEADITVNGATQKFYLFRTDNSSLGTINFTVSKRA